MSTRSNKIVSDNQTNSSFVSAFDKLKEIQGHMTCLTVIDKTTSCSGFTYTCQWFGGYYPSYTLVVMDTMQIIKDYHDNQAATHKVVKVTHVFNRVNVC